MARKANKRKSDKSIQTESIPPSIYIPIGKTLLVISGLMALVAWLFGIYFYVFIVMDAKMPPLNLNEWWGPNPDDLKHNTTTIRKVNISFKPEAIRTLRYSLTHRPSLVPPLKKVGFRYGFNTEYLNKVLDFWLYKYDFVTGEEHLNLYQNYETYIQGLKIHYVHVMPNTTNVRGYPLLLLHGWPSSGRQFFPVITHLINEHPAYDFVFELIIPSLPGFAFSEAPTRHGFGPFEAAVVMRNLMHRIGHKRFFLHAGGIGHAIGSAMATAFPQEVMGYHTNTPIVLHPLAMVYTLIGSLWPSMMTDPPEDSLMYPLSRHLPRMLEETDYLHIHASKPDTIGVALTDSPIGLAAYMLEKFSAWTHYDARRSSYGALDEYHLSDLLDHVMVYWASNCITTSMRMYAETFNKRTYAMELDMIPTQVPTAVVRFTADFMYQPDWILRLKYRQLVHSSLRHGGHFASIERPSHLAMDIFEGVDTILDPHNVKMRGFKAMEEKARLLKEKNRIKSHTPEQDLETQGNPETATTVYDFLVRNIQGTDVKLDKYKGHVLLIVNVASQCGLTDQNYQQLNELYARHADRGLKILAFPCNQFYGQEPGTPSEISNFIKERGVQFDVFEKVDVNGDNTHPLWKYLKRMQGGTFGDFIKWNFSKFIVDRNGVPVERFGPSVDPKDLEPHIVKYL